MPRSPLRARFGIVHRLDFYNEADVEEIVRRSARILGVTVMPDAAIEIARRSRGTPRGRVATSRAYEYFGLTAPGRDSRLW